MQLGYLRISKADGSQVLDLQRDALLAAGVEADQLYHDLASGKRDDRPGLAACLKALRQGDVLVAWKLDRLGRDLRHLVNLVHELTSRGVGLKILTGQGASIDTTTAAGKLVFGIFAALAEFERELIIERTRAGLPRARARGRKGGRPYKMTRPSCAWPWPPWASPRPRSPTSAASSASPGRRSTGTSARKASCAPTAKSCWTRTSDPLGLAAEGTTTLLSSTSRNDTPALRAPLLIEVYPETVP